MVGVLRGTQNVSRSAPPSAARSVRSSDAIWTSGTYLALALGSIAMLIPFLSMLTNSLKTDPEIQHIPPTLLPRDPQWHNYSAALGKDQVDLAQTLPDTVVISVCCVIGQVISSSLVGFGFARFRFRGRG